MNSMSGFSSSSIESNGKLIEMEINCVNSRFIEINTNIHVRAVGLQEKVVNRIKQQFKRGKFNIRVNLTNLASENNFENSQLLERSYSELQKFSNSIALDSSISLQNIISYSHLIKNENAQDDSLIEKTLELLDICICKLIEMRETEGKFIIECIKNYISEIEEKLQEVYNSTKDISQNRFNRLKEDVSKLIQENNIDTQRLYLELALVLEKEEITEEIDRLKSHIFQFRELLKMDEIGKKAKFLCQEMLREINTMGSKTKEENSIRNIVDMKVYLEKIREQVENLE